LKSKPSPRQFALLFLVSMGAIAVHGYHPFVEDGEIYVPGIKRALNPALYPYNNGFFASHARMTLFPQLIAGSIRFAHVSVEWGLFLWQFACIFMLLLACWHLGRLAFRDPLAKWGGVALVASLLTIPVAGTALYIMDQYLTTRALSAPAVLFIAVNTLERKLWRAGLWTVFTVLIHPLMAVFGLTYASLLWWLARGPRKFLVLANGASPASSLPLSLLLLLPFGLFPPVTGAYREVVQTRSYFFLLRWEWYEWVGMLAPMALLWWFRRIARQQSLPVLDLLCGALLWFGGLFFVASLVISIPPGMARFAELQPMRYLHLLYILLFVLGGGLLTQFVLKNHAWRWLLLFVPLCAGMTIAQRQLFPATPHIEWPGTKSLNEWVQAFAWIREHTPSDAYFALNPDHMDLPGEDQHGFRAIAERSMLADRIKDSGAVTMFPALADTWLSQIHSQEGWRNFQLGDFRRLRNEFGVDWVVLEMPGLAGMDCPYRNRAVMVCRIE
jgi:hypothetical protein